MLSYFLFGVRTEDIETARGWIEDATGLTSMARTNDHNGDYYTFGDDLDLEFKLILGICTDEDGDYPAERNFPDWKVMLYVSEIDKEAQVVRAIQAQTRKFETLRVKTL
jgi:hypothetical protein